MFFFLNLDSKDAFDLSLLETNLTECYLRSSGSSLPRSLSAKAPESWSPLCPPSLETNKCPSSEQWIQSFAFIGDTNPVFSVLDSASHCSMERGQREKRIDLKCILHLWQCCAAADYGAIKVPSRSNIWCSDVLLLLQGEIEWHFKSGIFTSN